MHTYICKVLLIHVNNLTYNICVQDDNNLAGFVRDMVNITIKLLAIMTKVCGIDIKLFRRFYARVVPYIYFL